MVGLGGSALIALSTSLSVVAQPAPATLAAPASDVPPIPSSPAVPSNDSGNGVAPAPEQAGADLRATRAAAVLERHCSRCHDAARLEPGQLPAGGLGNILDLDALGRTRALVRRGEPDASTLYQLMIARQMPPGLTNGATDGAPTADEIRAVREWIAGLDPAVCGREPRVTARDLDELMRAWLADREPSAAANTRFVSLAGLANACASDAQMSAYRKAVGIMLNALSWQSDWASLDTLGDRLALLAFRIDELGWTPEHWQAIVRDIQPTSVAGEATDAQPATPVPLVDASWLAMRLSEPALYASLLGLPPTLDELGALRRIDFGDAREEGGARRAVTLLGSHGPWSRVLEHYPGRDGGLWLAHEYPLARSADDLLDNPLLPWAATGSREVPDGPAVSKLMIRLPNGLPAFALFDHEERRQDRIRLTHESSDSTEPEPGKVAGLAATAGPGCRACHALGVQPFDDRLAPHLNGTRFSGAAVEQTVARKMIFEPEAIAKLMEESRGTHGAGLKRHGIDTDLRIAGYDPVLGLARYHMADLDLSAAAAELLVEDSDLAVRLDQVHGEFRSLALRLRYGRLSRAEFGRLLVGLSASGVNGGPPATAPRRPGGLATTASLGSAAPGVIPGHGHVDERSQLLRLDLWAETRGGERATVILRARATRDCHLTIINVESNGKATVLFPNEFDRDNLLKAQTELALPGKAASYAFALKPGVREHFVGICEVGEPVPAGIEPDLQRQNFTALGDWQAFLDTAHAAASSHRFPIDNGDDRDSRRRGAKPRTKPAPEAVPNQARAAIIVEPRR